jgi:hypothetical protein
MPSAWCIARDQEAVSQRYTYLACCSLGRFDLQRACSSQGLLDIWTELLFWTFLHEAWVWTKKPRITRAMDSRLKWIFWLGHFDSFFNQKKYQNSNEVKHGCTRSRVRIGGCNLFNLWKSSQHLALSWNS